MCALPIWGGLYPRTVADLAKAGAIGIKLFNTRHIKEVYPYISKLGVLDHGVLYELYEAVRDCNLVAAVHHDDPEWCKRLTFREYIDKGRSEEHTSEIQSLMRISYAVFCLKKKKKNKYINVKQYGHK